MHVDEIKESLKLACTDVGGLLVQAKGQRGEYVIAIAGDIIFKLDQTKKTFDRETAIRVWAGRSEEKEQFRRAWYKIGRLIDRVQIAVRATRDFNKETSDAEKEKEDRGSESNEGDQKDPS